MVDINKHVPTHENVGRAEDSLDVLKLARVCIAVRYDPKRDLVLADTLYDLWKD